MFSFSTFSKQLTTSIDIVINGTRAFTVKYPSHPRLDKVVIDALEKSHFGIEDINWLSSGLYEQSIPVKNASQAIHKLLRSAEGKMNTQWKTLDEKLQSMQFSDRYSASIDPDFTRLSIENNPRLFGHYSLTLNTVPSQVTILGNVIKPGALPWAPRKPIQQYLEQAQLINPAIGNIWVIQPDGKIYHPPVGYWNSKPFNIAPGAILYIPLENADSTTAQNPEGKSLNNMIVELLSSNVFS